MATLGLDEPPQPAKVQPYRVLARKYRPQTFAELIGQEAMVTTLGNAIKRGRLAHAFLLTGVRGVGKTSTARLIAKALNCIGPDGAGGPTIEPCGVCEPCRAITEGRYMDVIEIDAASHNGVEEMREITDNTRYAAVSARFKIYIVDEVHMLSKPAFNALLKTLEEPPAHVKFLLATTEVNKVPVTVLSRCQRFDLRRIPADKLAAHFAMVCEKEDAAAEPEALALIARAAEGSARDGLSILDQAIAHAGADARDGTNAMDGAIAGDGTSGAVTADAVRDMLGLSNRGAVRDLMALILAGDARGALAGLRAHYDLGVDPAAVLRALLELVHGVTLSKVGTPADPAHPAEEHVALIDWSGALSFAQLHRLWQLFLKGHDEVARATMPIEAAEMALLRAIHASSLPDPGELARQIAGGGTATIPPPAQATPPPLSARTVAASTPAPPPRARADSTPAFPADFAALVAALEASGSLGLAIRLKTASVVRYAPPELVFSGARPMSADTVSELNAGLKALAGRAWKLSFVDQPGAATLKEVEDQRRAAERQAVLDSPLVRAAMAAFPDAELEGWTPRRSIS